MCSRIRKLNGVCIGNVENVAKGTKSMSKSKYSSTNSIVYLTGKAGLTNLQSDCAIGREPNPFSLQMPLHNLQKHKSEQLQNSAELKKAD